MTLINDVREDEVKYLREVIKFNNEMSIEHQTDLLIKLRDTQAILKEAYEVMPSLDETTLKVKKFLDNI
ncbi:MAG: hypothetical protein ACO2ZP_00545 [Bacteriovoracaceae bacterium]